MSDKTPRVLSCLQWLLPLCVLALTVMAGCSASRAGKDIHAQEGPRYTSNNTSDSTDSATADERTGQSSKAPVTYIVQKAKSDADSAVVSEDDEEPADDSSDDYQSGSEDFWLAMQRAEEYYAMGCVANRDGSWEEAQYYFEKSLQTMADVDIDADSVLTPEAVKYNTLLDNIVSDYRVALRSLGRLDENAAPSAIVERFGDLESRLDSMVVTTGEMPTVVYDLPIVMNDRVKKSIVYFQTVANEAFTRYLSRSKKYTTLFKSILTQYGLPQDLIYLCLVESGYNPHAYSWARAMGLWQFIASTGKLYGLERNWWVDERKDPVKATHAAARFLKDLNDKFGSWDLAMAAYNGGPGRVERTISAQRTDDFWKLKLRQQTMDYVPLIYAATIIAKEPEKYGFTNIQFEPEVQWDEVQVDKALELNVVAQSLGCEVQTLKDLNPELLRNVTPPNTKNYTLKIPTGLRERFLAAYESMPQAKTTQWARHKVKRRETLARIANRYGVSQYAILEANNMAKGTRLKPGTELIIPKAVDRGYGMKDAGNSGKSSPVIPSGAVYTVRSGDTMWDIARAYGITTDELRRLNFLGPNARLKLGQKLKIPSYAVKNGKKLSANESSMAESVESAPVGNRPPETAKVQASLPKVSQSSSKKSGTSKIYIVKSGDTISELAARFGMTPAQLRAANKMGRSSRIFVGQRLKVNAGGDTAEYVLYQIKRGDTLGRIAQKYNTTVSRILAENGAVDPHGLRVGTQIKIVVD